MKVGLRFTDQAPMDLCMRSNTAVHQFTEQALKVCAYDLAEEARQWLPHSFLES